MLRGPCCFPLEPPCQLVNSQQLAAAQEVYLAADEFLSVFIFVLVQSVLDNLPVTCRFMSELVDPELLFGQHGYYLTVFESAVQCIVDADAEREVISAIVRSGSSSLTHTPGPGALSAQRGSAMSMSGSRLEFAETGAGSRLSPLRVLSASEAEMRRALSNELFSPASLTARTHN